ncbi:MAG: ATP-binding protein, partial [Planctomycetota bacterium]
TIHCLVDETREKRLESSYVDHLQQLTSMKEVIDTLYESLGTQEVLYLILVAVTSQMGFGFNRAFFLEAQGARLRGRIGIGPSSIDDAHGIWECMANLDLPNLRSIYEEFTKGSEPPDPQTLHIAQQLDFPIEEGNTGLLKAVASRKPVVLHKSEEQTEVDDELFERLGTESVAVVPLYVRQSLAGVLLADNLITRKPVSEESLSLLKSFSGYAGVALERSQLYDELQENVQKLQRANAKLRTHQQKLLQAEKLSAVGELAATVSHEIRNPLVAIGGLARRMSKSDSLEDSHRRDLGIMISEVSRLERFLKETLDFVKPGVASDTPVDLREELGSCVAAFDAEAERLGVDFRVDLGDEDVHSLVQADVLHRTIANLIKNALEAVEAGDRIEVRLGQSDYTAEILIADTGPGIPSELRERVFDPFFTTKKEGTGLGLAIVSQSIRSMGGRISLQADGDFNTIFSVTLPIEAAARRAARKVAKYQSA